MSVTTFRQCGKRRDGRRARAKTRLAYLSSAGLRAWIVAEAEAADAQRPLIVGLRGNRGNGPAKVRRCTQHIGGRLGKKERWGFSSKTIEEVPRGGVHNALVWRLEGAIKSIALQGIVTFYQKKRSFSICIEE